MHKTLIPVPAEVIDGFAANEHYKRMIFKNFFVHGVDFRGLQAGPPENRLAFFTDLSTSRFAAPQQDGISSHRLSPVSIRARFAAVAVC
jgi:hypothetical protein